MKISQASQAGTLESNDILVKLMPNPEDDIQINLKSVVIKQFGKRIREIALETLQEHGITSCICDLDDKGALDFIIKARIESAIKRSL